MKRLLIACLFSVPVYALPVSREATDAAAKAFYRQMHWDEDVNAITRHYENKLTASQKKWGGYTYWIAKVILDQEVRFTWTF